MEHSVDAQEMAALKSLADTNIKISDAKTALSKLKELETSYLLEREEKEAKAVEKVLDGSRKLILEAKRNYEEVQQFNNTVSSFADFLLEAYGSFKELVGAFERKQDAREHDGRRQLESIAEIRKQIKADEALRGDEWKAIDQAKKEITSQTRRLKDERGTLDRAWKELENKNKKV
jgi:hypothetical protein